MAHAGEKTLQPGEWLKHNVCSAALGELYVELHDQAVAVELHDQAVAVDLFSASDNARIAFCASHQLPKALAKPGMRAKGLCWHPF